MGLKHHNNVSKVSVLMSTYNGQDFLQNQLDSILNQSYNDIIIIIRDDGSSDRTLSIIANYCMLNPTKIFILKDEMGNLGSTSSFFQLMKSVNDDSYIMFSDQDDIWHKNKVELFIQSIKALEESKSDGNAAAMVFGDMIVVDEKQKVLSSSFWSYQKLNPKIIYNWKKVLSQNVVTGCSMIINHHARSLCTNLPSMNVIHDHYIAINVSKYGKVNYLSQQTMFYVQHQRNVVGASAFSFRFIITRMKRLNTTWSSYYSLCKHFKMNFIIFIYYKISINLNRAIN